MKALKINYNYYLFLFEWSQHFVTTSFSSLKLKSKYLYFFKKKSNLAMNFFFDKNKFLN